MRACDEYACAQCSCVCAGGRRATAVGRRIDVGEAPCKFAIQKGLPARPTFRVQRLLAPTRKAKGSHAHEASPQMKVAPLRHGTIAPALSPNHLRVGYRKSSRLLSSTRSRAQKAEGMQGWRMDSFCCSGAHRPCCARVLLIFLLTYARYERTLTGFLPSSNWCRRW